MERPDAIFTSERRENGESSFAKLTSLLAENAFDCFLVIRVGFLKFGLIISRRLESLAGKRRDSHDS